MGCFDLMLLEPFVIKNIKIKRPLGQRNCRRLIEGCGSVNGVTIIQTTANQNGTTF